jgi:hypothetical protein
MYPVAVSSILLLASIPALFLLCLHFSVAPDGEEEEEAPHTRNKSSYTYLHTTVYSGCNSEIGGRGERRRGEKTNISIWCCTQLSWWREKDAIYPRIHFVVFHFGFIPSLEFEGYLNQPASGRRKPKPSYNLSARSCHLTTAVFSLYTTDKHFCLFFSFFFASFLPSKRISKLPLLISFRLVFPPFVQCFLPTC